MDADVILGAGEDGTTGVPQEQPSHFRFAKIGDLRGKDRRLKAEG